MTAATKQIVGRQPPTPVMSDEFALWRGRVTQR